MNIEGKMIKCFDPLRRKYVALTAEESVRQKFVRWLIDEKGYPAGLIGNEVTLNVGGLRRRCDTVVYSRDLKPWMIIEYKAPRVEITQEVFEQILRYNIALHAEYLVVSNGLRNFCCRIIYSPLSYDFLDEIPEYIR